MEHSNTSTTQATTKTNARAALVRIATIAISMVLLVAIYDLLNTWFGFAIACWFERLTGWYCPGCGVTRMLFSILEGNFYQAFRFNPLVFILLGFGMILAIDYVAHSCKGTTTSSLYRRIPTGFWIVLLVIVLLYGLLRNLPGFEFLAPTIVP